MIRQLADDDVKFNYQMILNFRDFLSKSNNVEEAYLKFCRGEKINFPPLFLDQLVQNILRNILDESPIALQVRTAEIFFRSQVVSVAEDEIMLESIMDAKLQKRILQNKFNYKFETPHKDQAEFNAVHIIKPMYVSTIRYCLQDHLQQ